MDCAPSINFVFKKNRYKMGVKWYFLGVKFIKKVPQQAATLKKYLSLLFPLQKYHLENEYARK
jgi:hypothetical protein